MTRSGGPDFAALVAAPERLRRWLATRAPAYEVAGPACALPGGLLNHTWRVPARPAPLVLKWAPPHLASNPEVALDPARLGFEARALALLGPGGALEALADEVVRPPRLLWAGQRPWVVVMEWVQARGDMLEAVSEEGALADARALGDFIGRLHRATWGEDELAARFDNAAVQRTRHHLQYAPMGQRLADWGGRGTPRAGGRRFEQLGRRLQGPGRCLIMGDLWPRSVLVAPEGLRVIDWELCHFGRPAQDVAHLAAHLWMAGEHGLAWAQQRLEVFLKAWRAQAPEAATDELLEEAGAHFAAEILARTLGPFQKSYLYRECTPDSEPVARAVAQALEVMEQPARGPLALLRDH